MRTTSRPRSDGRSALLSWVRLRSTRNVAMARDYRGERRREQPSRCVNFKHVTRDTGFGDGAVVDSFVDVAPAKPENRQSYVDGPRLRGPDLPRLWGANRSAARALGGGHPQQGGGVLLASVQGARLGAARGGAGAVAGAATGRRPFPSRRGPGGGDRGAALRRADHIGR